VDSTGHSYALDRISSRDVYDALQSVRRGTIYDLGTEIGPSTPHPESSDMQPFLFNHYRLPTGLLTESGPDFDCSLEVITSSVHLGTHIDGLAHVVSRGVAHGGHDVRAVYTDFGWSENGMEHSRPIIGRGVLLDLARTCESGCLPDRHEITPEDIDRVLRDQGTEIRHGDVVLVRTGWMAKKYDRDPAGYFASQPGVGAAAGLDLYERGMAVLGTDTSGTEVTPRSTARPTTHRVLLFERGVHLIEILDLEQLAEERIYEFLFIGLPLKLTGATGSWLRPVALV
jgi:kynurenine formamidase